MKMYELIIRRLILIIPVLFGATIITFGLSHVFQNPIYSYITPGRAESIPDWQLERIRIEHHLDDPWYWQYVYYIEGLLQGDWGTSQIAGTDTGVLNALMQRFPATVELTLAAITVAILVGIPLGIISAVKKDSYLDHFSRLVALSGVSLPVFWLGLNMQLFFAHYIPLFPKFGRIDLQTQLTSPLSPYILNIGIGSFRLIIPDTGLYTVDSILTLNIPFFLSSIWHLVLPGLALSWISLAIITRMTRTSMLETLKQDYIILARSKGLSERVVIYKHALKNALIPTLTVIGLSFAGLLTGAVLTETVFSWPGIGRWVTQAILTGDSASIQGFVILAGLIYVILNLVVDISYTLVDPRIRYD